MEEKIIDIFSEVCGHNMELFNGETQLVETGVNSTLIVQIIVKIEQVFEIEIDDSDFNIVNITTLNDVFALVKKYIGIS